MIIYIYVEACQNLGECLKLANFKGKNNNQLIILD